MGIFDNLKAFVHSLTTEDHYASYDSPYKNSVINEGNNVIGGRNSANNSNSRLHELNRLATINSSSHSLVNDGTGNVGYRPGLRSSNANSTTDLPMQSLNANGQPPLPSIDSLWDRIEAWIDEEYPELEDYLNNGVTTADLNEFENDLGIGALPTEFRQFYKRHDGQSRGGKPTGVIMGLALLDLECLIEEYSVWSKVADKLERQQYHAQNLQLHQQQAETSSAAANARNSASNNFMSNQRSIPPNSIQSHYFHKGWMPFLKDHNGNQIALDLAPGPTGNWGQVIIFGRDFDTKLVIASSLSEFLFQFVTDLDAGNYQIDSSAMQEELGYVNMSRDDDYLLVDEEQDEGELVFFDKEGTEFPKGTFKGNLSYLEIMKRRALKKYGLAETFSTTYTPPRVVKRPVNHVAKTGISSGSTTPLRSQSPIPSKNTSTSTSAKSPLLNLDSTSKVTLPKETLIDDKIIEEEPKVEVKESEQKKAENEVDSVDISKLEIETPVEKEIETPIKKESETKPEEVEINE